MSKPLSINNVSKTFNKRSKYPTKALNDVSFDLNENEVTGLIGPNGAGKTTLIRIMMGFENSDKGSATIFGYKPETVEAKKQIGFQSDNQFKTNQMRVKQYLEFNSKLLGIANNKEQITYLLETFHMTNAANKRLDALSKGMRQKIELINAFIGEPKLVILDEPTAGLDPPSVFELRDFIQAQKRNGVTLLFSSHNLTEVEKISDRVLFINEGVLSGDYKLNETDPGFLEEAFRQYRSGGEQ